LPLCKFSVTFIYISKYSVTGDKSMYTIDDQGKLNNYAIEPTVYAAAYPHLDKQRRYLAQGAIAFLFLTSVLLTAFAVS
jgi:hypothetical protein